MKFLVKAIGWLLVCVLLLAVGLVIAVTQFVDPNDYKAEISQLVKKQTGRDLSVAGDIGLSFYPWLGLSAAGVTLSQPTSIEHGFGDQPMLEVEEVKVKAKLLPLLKKEVEIDKVLLGKPQLRLGVNKAGVANWQDLIDASSDSSTESAGPGESAGVGIAALAVNGVQIESGSIHWKDDAKGQVYRADNTSLETGDIVLGKPVDVALAATISGTSIPDPLALKLSTTFATSNGADTVTLSNIDFAANSEAINATLKSPEIKAQIAAGLLTGLEINSTANVNNQPLDLSLSKFDFGLNNQQLNLGGVTISTRFQEQDISAAMASGALDLAKETFNSPALQIKHTHAAVNASDISVTGLLSEPVYSVGVQTEQLALKALLSGFGVDLSSLPESALKTVSVATNVSGNLSNVALEKLNAVVDDSRIQGNVGISNFAQPAYSFKLQSDFLNIDNFVADGASGSSDGTGSKDGKTAAAPVALPLAALQGLNVDGDLQVGQLIAGGVTMNDVTLVVNAADGQVNISPLTSKLYGGSANVSATLDGAAQVATIATKDEFKDLDVGALLTAAGITDQFSGRGNLKVDLKASGNNDQELMQNNSGRIELVLRDGFVKGVDIQKILNDARSFYDQVKGRESQVETNLDDQTKFTELKINLDLKNGVASNDDFSIKAPAFRITGKGETDLVAQTLNYRLVANVVKTAAGQGGKDLSDLEGIAIPIRVKGPIANPEYYVDVAALVKARLDKELDKEKAKLKAKLDAEEEELKRRVEAERLELEQRVEREKEEARQKLEQKVEKKKDKLKNKLKLKLLEKLGG